jgi:subtilisin family serine protease
MIDESRGNTSMYHTTSERVRAYLLLLSAVLGWGVLLEDAAAAPPLKMSPLDHKEVATLSAKAGAPASSSVAVARTDKTLFAVLSVEFRDAGACKNYTPPEGAWVFHRSGRFANVFADVTRKGVLGEIEKDDSVRWIDMEKMVRVPPPPKEKDTGEKSRALGERIVRGGIDGLKGKGVVIAIIDTGVDFRHKDFVTKDADGKPTSRLLYFWDTLNQPAAGGKKLGRKGPYSYPTGASIGVLYTQADLTADLQSGKQQIAVTDTNGHGTACASIAAGNGAALSDKKYIGVAPEADIIAVRIGSGPGLENAYLLPAICSWLDGVCGDRPLVVSCSFGGQYGGHDGYRVEERQLDEQFALTRKGRALCIAAGNEAARPGHALIRCEGAKSPGSAAFVASGGEITIFANTDDPDDLVVKVFGYPGARVSRFLHGLSESAVVSVSLPDDDTGEHLGGELEMYSKSGKALEAHAYIGGSFLAGFIGRARARSFLIGTPGTTANAITVGSYDFNERFAAKERPIVLGSGGKPLTLGAISVYSNPGYLRLGKIIKPDVVAPGQYHIASLTSAPVDVLKDASGVYQPFNGTSAATPYAAGVIALLLECRPYLTLGQIKELLKRHASADIHTGKTPNPDWGYGKLDYWAVEAMVKAVKKMK